MTLPADLLHAIAEGNGRVVFVIGAGCSFESPTNIPLGKSMAMEANRRLVADRVLHEGDCEDPEDLSSVAEAVYAATGQQRPLVTRLPLALLRNAQPNDGYLVAAALLREQALSCVLTLNFDLALPHALASLGGTDVSVIYGPADTHELAVVNVVYLHRSTHADAEEWVLRASELDDGWGDWEAVIAHHVLVAPVAVFIGLGSPAGVLTETLKRIRSALPPTVLAYQVDPGPREESAFFAGLDLPPEAYQQMGWGQVMSELGHRLAVEHCATIEQASLDLIAQENLDDEDVISLCSRLQQLGLVGLGLLRASWVLSEETYLPHRNTDNGLIADLLLAVGLIERATSTVAHIAEDGVVEFIQDGRTLGVLLFASGSGRIGWLAIEPRLRHRRRTVDRRATAVTGAVVAGLRSPRPSAIAPPPDIASDEESGSILAVDRLFTMLSVNELRADPDVATRLLN